MPVIVTKIRWILKEWTPSWNMCQPVYVIVPMGKKCFSTVWFSTQHFYITKFSHESVANIKVFSSRMKWKIKDKISWNDSPMTMILRWRVKLIVLSWGPTHCTVHITALGPLFLFHLFVDGQVFDLKEKENKGKDLNSPAFVSNSSTSVVSKTFPGSFYTILTFIDSYNHVTKTRKYLHI